MRLIALATALSLALTSAAHAAVLDFNTWTVEGAPAEGNWLINGPQPIDPADPGSP